MVFESKKLGIVSLAFMTAMLLIAGMLTIQVADANQCAAQCYAQAQACMQSSKGDPSCNAALSSCLASCRGR